MNHQPSQERGKDMSQLSEEQLDQIIAADGHGRRTLAHRHASHAIDDGDRHDHTLRSASVALSLIPAIAGTMPLRKPVAAASPTPASIDSRGR